MISEDGRHILCEGPGCQAAIANHEIAKQQDGAGWLTTKSVISKRERHWCPVHIPGWHDPWRGQKTDEVPYRNRNRKARGL